MRLGRPTPPLTLTDDEREKLGRWARGLYAGIGINRLAAAKSSKLSEGRGVVSS